MKLSRLFRIDPQAAAARRLYLAIVEQARRPEFYLHYDVPDTVDGRFEMIAMHVFLVLHRLTRETAAEAGGLARALSESLFADMDRGLRELGAGDLGVGRRVQAMAQGFYGRVAAYESGLAAPDRSDEGSTLAQAVRRNVYGTLAAPGPDAARVSALCGQMRKAVLTLAGCTIADLAAGRAAWPPLTGAPTRPI